MALMSEAFSLMKNGVNKNMFNSNHYIPILKWKRAEQSALESIKNEDKEHLTPLIQFVMPKLTPKELVGMTEDEGFQETISKFRKKTKKIPEEILKAWGVAPVFIDFSLLYTIELKTEALEYILSEGGKIGTFLIPVLYLSDDQKIKEIVKNYKHGLCLRLVCADLNDMSTLGKKIDELLVSTGLKEEDVDLLVDIKEIEENSGKFSKYMDLSKAIPSLLKWRTFTFASGAFHEDLSRCKSEEGTIIPRLDWTNWVSQTQDKSSLRTPSFSDYTIQHPIYKESTQFFPPTTSIKYTLEGGWLILKGKKQKFGYYLANANLLVGDSRFYGEGFSYGDKYITEKAQHFPVYVKDPNIGGTGSTETWLIAGISHHLAVVVRQVSTLL